MDTGQLYTTGWILDNSAQHDGHLTTLHNKPGGGAVDSFTQESEELAYTNYLIWELYVRDKQ